MDAKTGPEEGEPDVGFKRMVSVPKIFTDEELDGLMQVGEEQANKPATTSGGNDDPRIRRSSVVWLRRRDGYDWIYDRIWDQIAKLNEERFQFDIEAFNGSIQLARYDSKNQGFYNWHMDNGDKNAGRKISFSVQVSRPELYRGGDLELWYKMNAVKAPRDRGSIIAFPSFVMHRVTPVTKGARYSLVAWIIGPRWR